MILVLGGYGAFGSRIVRGLCALGHSVIINGRNRAKAEALAESIRQEQPDAQIQVFCFDVRTELAWALEQRHPQVVIHTCGPFQGQDLRVPNALLQAGVHGIDLSDSRDYVDAVLALDGQAKRKQVSLVTGASTVPTLSSAVLVDWEARHDIMRFNQVSIGITPGQRADRGEATVKAVLSYLGKPLKPAPVMKPKTHGWLGLHWERYPQLGRRLMGACEAPDLDCLGRHFDLGRLRFSAGMESKLLHLLMWLTAWFVRMGLPLNLPHHSRRLMRMARWFDVLGSEDGGMHVKANALDSTGTVLNLSWHLEAFDNHGPQIPAVPAILLADRMLNGQVKYGAKSSVGLISLSDYLAALSDRPVRCYETLTAVNQ